jgi:hydroxypyruvate reductase
VPEFFLAVPEDRGQPAVRILLQAFQCGVEAASPRAALAAHFAAGLRGPALVLGAGKAAAAMAVAFNEIVGGDARGLVVTRYGHGLRDGESAGSIEVLEAGHPDPDAASLRAAERLGALAQSARPGESLWFLVSGGGSALIAAPLPGLSLAHKRRAAACLMHAGADIREINTLRRHLSAIKGGRLAERAHPTAVHTLAISDVPGNALADIASGPTIPDPTTQGAAREVLERYGCAVEPEVLAVLGETRNESPKPADPRFAADSASIIAAAATALDASEAWLRSRGFDIERLGDDLAAPARELGRRHGRLALEMASSMRPVALLSGGEATVVVDHPGAAGGRNLEYLCALAQVLMGHERIFALAADTDGIDGNGDHAGAVVVPELIALGAAQGLRMEDALERNSTYEYFSQCKLLLKTGPTRTNVNDFRLIIVNPDRTYSQESSIA